MTEVLLEATGIEAAGAAEAGIVETHWPEAVSYFIEPAAEPVGNPEVFLVVSVTTGVGFAVVAGVATVFFPVDVVAILGESFKHLTLISEARMADVRAKGQELEIGACLYSKL